LAGEISRGCSRRPLDDETVKLGPGQLVQAGELTAPHFVRHPSAGRKDPGTGLVGYTVRQVSGFGRNDTVIDHSHLTTDISDELMHVRLLPQKAGRRILQHAAIHGIGRTERPEGIEENGPKPISLRSLQRDRAPLAIEMDPMWIARRMAAMPSTEAAAGGAHGRLDDALRRHPAVPKHGIIKPSTCRKMASRHLKVHDTTQQLRMVPPDVGKRLVRR
jgi:hypothetical protein